MRRLLALTLALAASGCTCILNPDRVRPPVCPHTADFCGARTNASASCGADGGEACEYTCAAGFVDSNGDLGNAGGDGCDRDCAGTPPPVNPLGAIATVGVPGSVELNWPMPMPSVDAFQVCIGPNYENCQFVPAAAVCSPGAQSVCTLIAGGLPENVRIRARIRSVSFCRGIAPELGAPTVGFSPINPLNGNSFDIDYIAAPFSNCSTAMISEPAPGELLVSQMNSGCLTKMKIADDQWGDLTASVEMMVTNAAGAPDIAGIGVQADATGHVSGVGFSFRDADRPLNVAYWPGGANQPNAAASSIFTPRPNEWVTLQVVISGEVFSISAANQAEALAERIRWPSPEPNAAMLKGRPGLFTYGAGAVRFRNFRVSTSSTIPTGAPTSSNYTLSTGSFPTNWKIRGTMPIDPTVVTCPGHFTNATACVLAGGCSPPAGARCARLQRSLNTGGTAGFDIPVGIDVRQPYSASMRFGVADAGVNDPNFLTGQQGPLLYVNGGRPANLRTVQQDLGAPVEYSRWHHAAWRFHPDAGTEFRLDGQAPIWFARPPAWDRHVGALLLGGTNNIVGFGSHETYITDINVSQP